MAIDAYVNCTCFADGKANPFERPDVIGTDEYGGVILTIIRLGNEELVKAFSSRTETACAHPGMMAANERISNIGGCNHFLAMLGRVGWHNFPTLKEELFNVDGAMSPALAHTALGELELFKRLHVDLEETVLVDTDTGEIEYHHGELYRDVFYRAGQSHEGGFDPSGFF